MREEVIEINTISSYKTAILI